MTSISNGESGLSVRTKLNASLAITDAFNVSNGNVGIGVIPSAWSGSLSPSLQLNGGASFAGHSVVKSTFLGSNYYYDGVYRYYSSDFAAQYQMYQGNHIWYNAPSGTVGNVFTFTQAMTLDAGGNLGIGTSSPSFSAGSGLHIYRTSGAAIKVEDASTNADLLAFGGTLFLTNRSNGPIRFATNDTERMRIDASGNVGIGTTAPASGRRLDVRGGDITVSRTAAATAGDGAVYFGNGDTSYIFGGNTTNIMAFAVNSAERMRIDASGNVGLGVTPSAWGSSTKSLSIGASGAAFIEGRTDSFRLNVGLNAYDTGIDTWKYAVGLAASLYQQLDGTHRWYNAPSGTAGNAITFTQAMTLDASGNLGIGMSSPNTRLYVSGSNPTNGYVATISNSYASAGRTGTYLLFDASSLADWKIGIVPDVNAFSFYDVVAAAERFRFGASGQLGIGGANYGTSGQTIVSAGSGAAPAWGTLPVAGGGTGVTSSTGTGSVVLSNNPAFTGQASFADGTAAAPSIAHTGDLNAGIFFPAADTVAITTSGTEAMRIDASGNVGVGTTSPNAASMLDAQSTTKGVRFPNMTTTQKNAIANVAGNVVFDTTLGKLCVNTGSGWQTITSV